MATDNKQITKKRHIHISSKHKWFDLKLKEVWHYRDLIWLFTKRSFTVTYKQTVLGPAWLFLNPIITSLIYAFVFGGIAGIGTDGVPQILFYLSGTAIWTYFASTLTKNANTFTANAGIFGKVYFPRLTTPISNVLSSLIQFAIQFLMVLAFLVFFVITGDVSPNWWAFSLIPIVLIHLGLMGMGLGIIISSMTTKYRDLSVLVGFGVSLWMYATPVVYPLSTLGDSWMKIVLLINPVTMPVEIYRYAVLGKGTIIPLYLAISWMFTIIVVLLGIVIFNRVERNFMDTV
jgi:lipopolysaccharide transport system permease protein